MVYRHIYVRVCAFEKEKLSSTPSAPLKQECLLPTKPLAGAGDKDTRMRQSHAVETKCPWRRGCKPQVCSRVLVRHAVGPWEGHCFSGPLQLGSLSCLAETFPAL